MPSKRRAKVLRVGTSVCVVIPKDWAQGMGLEIGDDVDIVYNGCMTVRPAQEAGSA